MATHRQCGGQFRLYLGSLLSSDGYCRPDINQRIGLASSVMSALHSIWKDRYLSIIIKIRIYQALVKSVLLPTATSTCLLVDHPTTSGNTARVDGRPREMDRPCPEGQRNPLIPPGRPVEASDTRGDTRSRGHRRATLRPPLAAR